MKKKKTSSKKARRQVVHAYQSNPYALQPRGAYAMERRNATPPPELVPVVVTPPPRRRRAARAVRAVKQTAMERLGDSQFLGELGTAIGGAGLGAAATGWAAGKGWSPWAVGLVAAGAGGLGAVALPGFWRGAGIGVAAWGAGQLVATGFHEHALAELERKKKADEEKKAIEQARADQQRALEQASAQRALPPPKPSNAFRFETREAPSNARTYGHYGRADDEERMTDLDLVLG